MDERVMEVKDMCEAWDGAVKLQAQIEGRVIAQELAPKMAEEMAEEMAKEMAIKMAGEIIKKRLKKQERKRKKQIVYNMFAKGYPQEEISEILNLPFSKVKKWCKNFSKDAAVEMA